VSRLPLTIIVKPKLVVKPRFTTLKLEVVFNELAISTLASAVKVTTEDGHEATIEPLNAKAVALRTPSGQYYERCVRVVTKSTLDVREAWHDNRNEIIVENALYVI
jgi:hypothetical protein